jgi:hypothetical protein
MQGMRASILFVFHANVSIYVQIIAPALIAFGAVTEECAGHKTHNNCVRSLRCMALQDLLHVLDCVMPRSPHSQLAPATRPQLLAALCTYTAGLPAMAIGTCATIHRLLTQCAHQA